MAQTAVEWLFEKVWITPVSKMNEVFEQAKKLEKQQIVEDFENGIIEGLQRMTNSHYNLFKEPEQYYEHKYGGTK